jgi:hypothetical protein
MPNDIQTGICVYDLHYPYHNKELWQNILKVAKELKPDFFIFGGDNLDMEAVNHWELDKGNKRAMEGKRLRKSYDTFQSEILDSLKLPSYCRKIFMYGNHEEWIEKYIDKCPELEGFAEIERNLDLKEWEIIPYHHTVKVGKIHFHHGEYTSKHHACKMVDVYERNIISFHLHTFQVHTKVTPIDGDAHSAYSMPCACKLNPGYMKDKPSAWVSGFGVFYLQPNGNFNIYPVISSKGHFVFNGKYY